MVRVALLRSNTNGIATGSISAEDVGEVGAEDECVVTAERQVLTLRGFTVDIIPMSRGWLARVRGKGRLRYIHSTMGRVVYVFKLEGVVESCTLDVLRYLVGFGSRSGVGDRE